MDTAVKSDSIGQFRSYLVREEIDVKLDGALQSQMYTPLRAGDILPIMKTL